MAYHATEADLARFADPTYSGGSRVRDGAAIGPDGAWLKWLTPEHDGWLHPDDIDYLVAHYDAQIHRFDRAMANLFAYLERSGLRDDTIVIITADHGESFYERGFWGHGFLSRDEEQHVPLLVLFPPGSREPKRVAFPITTTDIFHSILTHYGAGDSTPADALPQVADLFQATPRRAVAYSEGPGGTRIYRDGRFSLYQHRALESRKYPLPTQNGDFLFDVSDDAQERHDLLAGSRSQTAAAHRDGLLAQGPTLADEAVSRDPMLSARGKLRESLRALGYVSD